MLLNGIPAKAFVSASRNLKRWAPTPIAKLSRYVAIPAGELLPRNSQPNKQHTCGADEENVARM
ncbi:hypothetical protein COCC4DRAFT_32288 [Bipolaris maydis ATCC 48331]|uniref:Uncharacterized protein n=2 Tax=Cochliobolus heterostrophus TaxID=5016 RepID=M2UM45_COCH5|nr:uncharacterized protein COCC4DRAFT_32288 [Bipolaris maydis ATCC 48331]EMD89007.1 hypothetical protein COCHEDRAFT_1022560 [Bipolaris maydis C5]ENI05274.1 hypothetical protein COCC4DRAFT_32288 [Bipolaris maydis ATCC 48331]